VIFYSATYHQREARELADACGVRYLLAKPSKPEVILATINEALGMARVPTTPPKPENFHRDHLVLLTDTLTRKMTELEAVNLRLAALIELGQQLVLNHEPRSLLDKFCRAARHILAAKFAAVGILADDGESFRHFVTGGIDAATAARIGVPAPNDGLLGRIRCEGVPLRLCNPSAAPGVLGFSDHHPHINSFLGTAVRSSNRVHGVMYLAEKIGSSGFDEGDEQVVVTLAAQLAVACENVRLIEALLQANRELAQSYDETLEGWVCALDLRDKETEGHAQRVTRATLQLAQAMAWPEGDLVNVRRGALLHDIGKIGIPDGILLKPGPLTDEEWKIMRRHPSYAQQMLAPIAYLKGALDIPYCHHEKWDGTGYPRGLKEEEIPLAARLFAVVDVWDALSFDRPYRRAWPAEKVRAYLAEQAGRHFDPEVVPVFLELNATVELLPGAQATIPV
jgi:HD-GYP domain-containing protein (c-di-GMP phosphodiesterase class II)